MREVNNGLPKSVSVSIEVVQNDGDEKMERSALIKVKLRVSDPRMHFREFDVPGRNATVFISSSNESHRKEVEQLVQDLMKIDQRSTTTSPDPPKAKKATKKPLQPDVQKAPKVNEVADRTRPPDNVQSPPEPSGIVEPVRACDTCEARDTCESAEKRLMKLCSGCRSVRYCSAECQLKAWPKHRAVCEFGRGACVTCGSTEKRTKLCSGCRRVRYCGPECQLQAWPEHRAACKFESTKQI